MCAWPLLVVAFLEYLLCARVWVHLDNFNVSHGQHLFRQLRVVVLVEHDLDDASLDYHLGAQLAGEGGSVQHTS